MQVSFCEHEGFLCEAEECCCNFCFAESFPEKDPIQALKCYSLGHPTCLGSLLCQIQFMAKLKKPVSYWKGLHDLSFLCSAGNKVCHGETPALCWAQVPLTVCTVPAKGPASLCRRHSLQPALTSRGWGGCWCTARLWIFGYLGSWRNRRSLAWRWKADNSSSIPEVVITQADEVGDRQYFI